MAWDFSTEPEFEEKLAWMRTFVREEVMPLETLDIPWETMQQLQAPLKQQVKDMGLWAAHLPPDMGGMGFGQVKLALMHEIIGAAVFGSHVFGNMAPDSGNAELIAVGGDEDQKAKWMQPLLDGQLRSAFSMTEPNAGADPTLLETEGKRDGDEWVINGWKWFTSNAPTADFFIVMCKTNPENPPHRQMSMIIVPKGTPGLNIERVLGTMAEPYPEMGKYNWGTGEGLIHYENVRVPLENMIGNPGEGFELAQKRLVPGRIHHAMRWIGQANRAFDMMCERAVSRYAFGSVLAEKQSIQNYIADSAAEIHAFRLMVLYAAWQMDHVGQKEARHSVAMVKYFGSKVLFNAIDRSLQVHGSLGYSTDMPLELMYRQARAASIVDGPDEVHRASVARRILKGYEAVETPTEHVPTRRAAAEAKFADLLDQVTANL